MNLAVPFAYSQASIVPQNHQTVSYLQPTNRVANADLDFCSVVLQ